MNNAVGPANEAVLRTIAGLMRSGRLAEARAQADRALVQGMASEPLLAVAGMLAWRTGDPAGAVAPFRALLAHQPADRATRLNLAAVLAESSSFDEIEPLLAPLAGDPSVDRRRAFAAQQTGAHEQAIALYEKLLRLQPDDTDSWNNLGNTYASLDAIDDAVGAFERAITLRPDDPRIYLNLARVLERADRRSARLRVMRDARNRAPDDPEVLLTLGLAEEAQGEFDAAEATFRRAIDRAPEAPAAYLELGLLLETRNKLDALNELAEQAQQRIGTEAALIQAWAAFRAGRHDQAATLADTISATINPIRRLQLLAQIADRRGNAALAFTLFDEMNGASLAAAPALRSAPSYYAKVVADTALLRATTPLQLPSPSATTGILPTFIVGFPRSGTTLLDMMLSGLPDTYVLEERPLMAAVEARLSSPSEALQLDQTATDDLRTCYFETLRKLEPGWGGGRLIDKHPLHMARMPLIHQLFPGASVLLAERHPYDVVLSCFMANFELNLAMRSFVTIEEAARTYDAVFTAWTTAERQLPLKVHRVRYERLVDDVHTELADVLAFLKIDAHPRTLDHRVNAKERGAVRTASYSQVTEPIYRRAVARWRRYADQLAPVMPILAPWAERMGYETG